jgi:D-3-phosphoglycerate dehydrogenase
MPNNHNYKLVVLARSFARASSKPLEYLEKNGITVEIRRNNDVNNEERVAELIGNADAAIVGSDKIGDIVFEKCANLKVISKHGVGLDSIDLEAAKKRGIAVLNTPGANHESVADLTWLLILAASRNLISASLSMKQKDWKYAYLGNEVYRKTIGIIGYGRIGKAVARRAIGFENTILVYDPKIEFIEQVDGLNLRKVSLETLLKESDIITLHAPLTSETEGMIGEKALKMVKPGIIIINTSRGELIDEKALYDALISGRVKMAALDVFSQEPPEDSPLLSLKNVIPTPHIGTHTVETNLRMGMMAAENVVKALALLERLR